MSVVITFHNEHWTTLWRTVYSVIDSALVPITEILLVDDGSVHEQFGADLKVAASLFREPPIKLVRLATNSGPTFARVAG